MKIPGIPLSELKSFGSLNRILWLGFKICLPFGVIFLVGGTVLAGLLDAHNFGNRIRLRVSAIAEIILALACACAALVSILDGYVYVRAFSKSVRLAISGALANAIFAILLLSGAVVLIVMAFQDWVRP